MLSKLKISILVVLAALVFVAFNVFYIVGQAEQVLVLQFGEPIRVVKEPGLKMKTPFIQNLVFYDKRLLRLDPPAQSIILKDQKRLEVDSFTRYQIIDPLKYYKTVRTEVQARSKLEEIVNSSVRRVLGQVTLPELLSVKRNQIMKNIRSGVMTDAEEIGVKVVDVRIRRADLPTSVLQSINERMKAEREREAKEFRAQGEQKAKEITAQADKEKIIILAEAEKQSEILRGQGDKEAIALLTKAANSDPKFYAFYRSLEAYKKALANSETSMVISPDSEFFDFFKKTLKTGN
ncbi:MAG: protease modulator HflC [Alphaproteobacteria bacterium]|nr:protease modulator HflC [Alphaproteobacteria bacterium]